MPLTYVDPWAGVTSQYKLQPNEDKPEQNSGFFGDLIDSVQQGAYQSVAGDAEAIGQVSGSDAFKEIGKTLAKQANSQSASMTDESRQALSQHIFKEDPDSLTGVAFDDGASNWRTWALQFGVLGGQVVGTIGTGLGVGSVAKFGAKTAIKAFAKEAVTKEAQQLVAKSAVKEAIRNGALNDVRQSLLEAPTKQAVNEVLNKATSRLNGIATTAAAGAMAAGMRAQQARDEYMSLDQDALNANPEFQKMYWEIADAPENQGLDTSAIYNAAKEQLAERAATDAFFDKKALLSDLASGAYVPGVGGILERGAATASKLGRFGVGLAQEGATEAWQGGETQRAVNEAIREWGDESRDPMASVIQTRWEEGVRGGLFGGAAKVFEGQRQSSGEPIVRVEETQRTGNSALDQALAQSDADEQARYSNLTDHVDALSKPAFMRNGEISAELENAITQFRMDAFNRQQQEQNAGVMKPFNNPVTGNPDEPAFLRSEKFNPTGRDLSGYSDANPASPVQEALARSASEERSVESQLAATMAKGDQGKTPQEDFVTGEWLRWDQRRPMTEPNGIEQGVTRDGSYNEILPESRGLGYNHVFNMSGEAGNSINDNYIPPVTQDRVSPDRTLDVESTRDPRSPVARSIANAGTESDSIFGQLRSLRVTKRGKPFGSVKEAQLASRKTETPIELPTGGFGVVDKAELEQAQAQASQAPTATDINDGTKSDKVIDQASLNDNGDNRESPWLFADGKVVSSNGDHISLSDEYGYSGYRDMSKGAGAIRSTFYKPHNATDEQTPFVSLQLFDDQKLTPEQFKSVESFVKANDAKITLGVDRSGNNTDNVEKNEVSLDELKDKYTADQLSVPPTSDTVATNESLTGGQSDYTNVNIIEHKTGKGKTLRGVVRNDLTVNEAKAIDPYTFKKDGGYFIREKHLDKLPPVKASTEPANDFTGKSNRELETQYNELSFERTHARREAVKAAKANGEDVEAAKANAVKPFDAELEPIVNELKKRNGLTDELSDEEQRNSKLREQEVVTKSTGNSFSKPEDAEQWGKQRGLKDTHYVVPEGDTWTGKAGYALKKLPEPNAGDYRVEEYRDKQGVYRTAIIGGNQDVIHAYAVNQFGYGSVNKNGHLSLHAQKELRTKKAVLIPAGEEGKLAERLKQGNTPKVDEFVPRDGWQANLQAAREYANHLRKAGKISEQSALKTWHDLDSLVGLISKATEQKGKVVDFSKAKTVKEHLDMWDSLQAGDSVIDVHGIDRGTVFSKLKSERIVKLSDDLNNRDNFSIAAITGGGSDIVAQLDKRIANRANGSTNRVIDGERTTIHTPKGKPVAVQYQVVSASDLVTSNEFDGKINPEYPQELQPRDRTKASYQQQVRQIAANPEGSRLAESPESDRGAPIIRDLVVESGNGRTIGLKQAYKQGTAGQYRDYLIKNAHKFGFEPQQIEAIQDPVLVRQRISDMTTQERLDFVVDSNTDAKMANSATEDAKADARYLDEGLMGLLNIPEGGDLLAASNEGFLSAFANKLGANSLNSYKDSAGRWNDAYRKRVSNAIFAYGYDNDTLLKAATGDTSESGKNLTNALMNSAAKVAELRSMEPNTAKSFVGYLAEGIDVLASAKRNGQSIQEVVNQGDLLSGGVSQYAGSIAEMLSDASRSGKRMTETIGYMVDRLSEPAKQVTAEEAINAAERNFTTRKQQEQQLRSSQDLFGANPPRIGDNNEGRSGVSGSTGTSKSESQGLKQPKKTNNKYFTDDMAEAARKRLKEAMFRSNAGFDPQIMLDGITLAGWHIEQGARTFASFAKSMIGDLGDGVKPYLKSWYMGVKYDPRSATFTDMSSAAEVEAFDVDSIQSEPEVTNEPDTKAEETGSHEVLREGLYQKLSDGEDITNNNELKRHAAEILGIAAKDLSTMQLKEAQEAYEAAAIRHRRAAVIDVLGNTGSVKDAFANMVEAYESQPNLDVRTAKSSDLQAYSTPAPMSLLANIAAKAWGGKTVFEPTAGNGLLLLTTDSKTTYANELDPVRANSLVWSGFNTTIQDATNNPFEGMVPEKVDAVLANPPFGKYRDAAGKPTKVEFVDNQGRAYALGEIDHIIAKNALDTMKDDGKAALILGAPKEAGEYTGNNKVFLNWLYSNYNVVHHIEVDGSLYRGQGAAWPTQMIVVHGRAKLGTGKFAPFKGEIKRLTSWDAIYDSFNQNGLLDTKGSVFTQRTGNGNLHDGYEPSTNLSASESSDNKRSIGTDSGTVSRGAGSTSRSTGSTRGGRVRAGGAPDGTFDSQPDISGSELENAESRSAADTENPQGAERANSLGLSGQRNGDAVTEDYRKRDISTSVKKVNDFQAEYQTASEGFNDGVLTPINMASYTQKALADIQERHGSVDKYVASRLGYQSKRDLHKAFMGLQADAVALAVDAMEKGRAIIIGDQTGVGKGRQAAGVIRYALQQGKTPIFITQKPNLFTDMYDDLADIGVTGFQPFIVNQENGYISKDDKKLFNWTESARSEAIKEILKTGKLPKGYHALFLTYSQISNDRSGTKTMLLHKLADNSIMVMDESHTASGQDSKLGLEFQALVQKVHGLVYLSATYAKRPDNMLLYTRTDLGMAVENHDALVSIISNGGLGMQTYIAGKLAEAGQMVRRERSFDGISIKNEIINDKSGEIRKGFDQATAALRAIQDLSAAWRVYVETALAEQIQKESGMDTAIAGNQADTKVDVTLFSSVVHNYIAQLSLGMKAKETAKLAIAAIKRGERPVIALENTMGAAMADYMERTGRRVGDKASDLNFATLLKSIADGSLAYTVKNAGEKKGKKFYVKVRDIPDPYIQALYQQVMDAADSMTVDIPASPIDTIRHEITQAGYSVAEITGRDLMIDYSKGGEIVARPADEKNRRRVVDHFNSKKLDVLILNQAGSTGLSIHASEKFANKQPRHMIVAQPSLDINTFLQMLGRVNRTGQIELPSYSLAWLDLPSEKRPAAVLSRKMSSLNANTSGNTDSATSIDAVDILNEYGNQVVTKFVEQNRDMLRSYNPSLVELPQGDEAVYFMGKLAVLPSDIAEQVMSHIEREYNDLIAYLDATGQNELNTTEVDLDAKPISQRIVSEGRKNAGVFSEPTYVTKVDVKAQGKAPKWEEVQAELANSDQAEFDEAVQRMKADQGFAKRLQERLKKAEKELEQRRSEGKKTENELSKVLEIKEQIKQHEADKENIEHLFSPRGKYHHGAVVRVRLPDADEAVTGIVTGLQYESDGGNPTSPSKWRLRIMVADRVRALPINLGQAEEIVEGSRQETEHNLKSIYDRAASLPAREIRHIMTGNLVEAQNRSTEKGRIIPFTTADGRVIQGMLMPKKFDPEKGSIKEEAKVTSAQAIDWLTKVDDNTLASFGLRTRDNTVTLRRQYGGDYVLELPKAVSKGKQYWGNPRMVEIIGEHAVKGNGRLNIRLTEQEARAVTKVMDTINPLTIIHQAQIADYNRMTGKKVPTFSDKNIKFSKVPMNEAEQAGKGMKAGEATLAAKEWLRQFKTDIQVKVARNQVEFNQMLSELGQAGVSDGEIVNGAYVAGKKTVVLNASAIQNPARLRQVMRHEILGHHGLEYVIGRGAMKDIWTLMRNGYKTSAAIREAIDTVAKNYGNADLDTMIHEAFAHYAENRPVDKGAIGRLWDRVKELVKSALVKAGFIKPNEAEQQLDSLLKTIAEHMRNGATNNDPNGGPGKKTYFSKAVTDDEIRMAKLGLGPKPSFTDKTKAQLEQLRKADKSTVKAWLDQLKRKANTQILDALAPIKYAEEQAGKLDASDSGYVAARLASGSASVMQATMMYGIPQWKDGVIQRKAGTSEKDSLLGIFEELGSDLHNWLAWMAGHRAEILMREGRENLLTEDDIKALKAKSIGKEAKFKAAKEKWNTLNKAMLDLAQEAGLFTADDRAAFESEWYVPFFRETDDGDVMGPYKKNGIANQSSGIKKLKGGTANVNDILENIFQTTSKLIDSSMKNMAAQKVVYNLADTDLIEVVTKPNMLDIKAAVQNKQNLMIVKMEGENYLIRVNDPDLFRAMTMIDGTVERDPFRKAAMKAKHILTAGVTASPDFMLRNFLRDAASTWAINEDGFKPMIDSIRGVKKAWKMDDSSVDMMFSGASFIGGNLRDSDPEAMASVIRKTLRRKGMSPEQISKYENSLITNGRKAKDVLLSAWEKYEKAGEAVENGSREAVYEAAIKAGKSHAQAAFEAKDLMDFSMLGSSKIMRYMVDVLPFFNARMQGLGKLGRAVAANPKQIAKRGGMIAAASLALMALNWDDDRYKNLPDWDKDLNWHFWLGDEHFRIPKPFEVGLMFGTLPERMIRVMGGKDTAGKFGQVVARNILETFSVNPIPQVVKPLTELYFNYDMFRGAPIENMSDLNVAPEARYDERTSLLMRELGQITGLSPKKLEHFVTGYTGTIGAYVIGAGDAIVRASGDYGKSPSFRADELPIIKSVYQGSGPAKSSQAMTDFYQLLDEANQVYYTARQYQKEGQVEEAQELLNDNRNKLSGRKTLTNAQKQFRQIRNEMELIQRDHILTPEQKRARIDALLEKRNNFASKLIERFGSEL